MQTITKTYNIYEFDELPQDTRKKVIEKEAELIREAEVVAFKLCKLFNPKLLFVKFPEVIIESLINVLLYFSDSFKQCSLKFCLFFSLKSLSKLTNDATFCLKAKLSC